MSLELLVYAAATQEPSPSQIGRALDAAGWRWFAIAEGSPMRRATQLHGVLALGWDPAEDLLGAVETALDAGFSEMPAELVDRVCVVAVEVERPFRPAPDLVAELFEEGHEPQLVTRIQEAAACYRFTLDEPCTDDDVEFLWALACVVGVLTDGILEDVDEGVLLDCTDTDDE